MVLAMMGALLFLFVMFVCVAGGIALVAAVVVGNGRLTRRIEALERVVSSDVQPKALPSAELERAKPLEGLRVAIGVDEDHPHRAFEHASTKKAPPEARRCPRFRPYR